MNKEKLIEEVLFNGCMYNTNNTDGYAIGTGYGCGNRKEFYYPYSQCLEYTHCLVSVEDIEEVRKDMEKKGWMFDIDGTYISMCGERKAFKPFVPNPRIIRHERKLSPKADPVGYYCDRLFTQSKNGDLGLF